MFVIHPLRKDGHIEGMGSIQTNCRILRIYVVTPMLRWRTVEFVHVGGVRLGIQGKTVFLSGRICHVRLVRLGTIIPIHWLPLVCYSGTVG
mgnify:CR=1 FL=1